MAGRRHGAGRQQAGCGGTLVLTLTLTLAGWLAGCGGHGHAEQAMDDRPAVPVEPARAEARTVRPDAEVLATITAEARAGVAAQISGPVERVHVRLGDRVSAGDKLVEINNTEIRARLIQAQASLDEARRFFERQQLLAERDATDAQSVDAARARFEVAQGQVEELRTILNYATIRAPFDGLITARHVDPGDLATPGRPLLQLEDPATLQAEAAIPESLIFQVTVGQAVSVQVEAPGLGLAGNIREIAPAADPVTRTFLAKIALPEHPRLMSGQFARVRIPEAAETVVTIPGSALRRNGQLEQVFVIDQATGRARLRLVQTGRRFDDGQVEILSGLEAGTPLAAGPALERLEDGQSVTLPEA